MTVRPFRFGLQVHSASSRDEWVEIARRAEALGYDVVCVPDHVGTQLSPFAALQAIADATERIRVGTLVLDNDFRHPLLTAHEAATVHLLSGGRLELGIGAGWLRRDYERLGVEFSSPGTRVERLEEAVAIVARYFEGETFSFTGRHYRVADAEPLALPAHLGRPRLLIGGGGRRVLALAAAHADVASVFLTARPEGSAFEDMDVGTYRAKIEHLGRTAAQRGNEVEVNVLLQAYEVTDDRPAAVDRWAREFETTPEDFVALPFGLAGTIDEIVDDLTRRREEYGVSYVTVRLEQLETFAAVVERLAGT
jgi:probable F420-dependent oxidoreductase